MACHLRTKEKVKGLISSLEEPRKEPRKIILALQNYVFSTAKTLLLCNMTSKRLCLFSCLLLFCSGFFVRVSAWIWHFPSEATTSSKFGVGNFVESFGFRISRQLIRFVELGVTDLFVYWISLEK